MLVVFDLDGTLTDTTHRNHHLMQEPKNWDAFYDACSEDGPKREVITILNALGQAGHIIEIWTGRREDTCDKTNCWLTKYCAWRFIRRVLMRSVGDCREDTALKRAWLEERRALRHASKGHKLDIVPELVFEDRQRVVEMWREQGIQCLQTAAGNF